ncbi:MAG: response regulator [Chloroflexi bacterium]|nr:response regulator [Chloroflexota bacterium]
MSEKQHVQELHTPPETFIKQVKDAMEHLYDFSYLQRHPLAQVDGPSAGQPGETPSQRLRRELVAAIETLNPGPNVPFRAPHARVYNLLLMRYVEGVTVQEAAHDLAVSRRQAHRDLRRGEESVAAILWMQRPQSAPKKPSATRLSSIQAEIARLETSLQPTDISALLEKAQSVVEWMASQRSVTLDTESTPEPAIISTDPVLARQVLTNTLSQAVGQAQPGPLYVSLVAGDEEATLVLRYDPEPEAAEAHAITPVVEQLVDRLGWEVKQKDALGGTRVITLRMTAHCPIILVIDDNEGLVVLLSDYLSGHACQVMAATNGQEGLRLAQELLPDTIILDVMMPEMDGWEILQRLRTNPQTANVPVIVCSVINNPELAYSLRASLSLTKPISRDDILNALRQLGVV